MGLNPGSTEAVSIVPESGLQFLSVTLQLSPGAIDAAQQSYLLRDRPDLPEVGGKPAVQLVPATPDQAKGGERGRMLRPDPETALRAFSGDWIPLPYLRLDAPAVHLAASYKREPGNWARLKLDALGEQADLTKPLRAVLALDTAFTPPQEGGLQRRQGRQDFVLCPLFDAVSWFVAEEWVDQWLVQMLRHTQEDGAPLKPMEHQALYLTFLRLLSEASGMPRLRLIDVVSGNLPYKPIDVDFILDVGNCRTCGVLVENDHRSPIQGDLNNSYALQLCDLERPEVRWSDPFESRVEFARSAFGSKMISRRSDREMALEWLSPLRVGPEAIRLAAAAVGNEGLTGLSAPKRYLWDIEPTEQYWHFNSTESDVRPSPVRGEWMQYVHESGATLNAMPPGSPSAGRAVFSKSSLFMFMMMELLSQALRQINAPDQRRLQNMSEVPRRLRRLVLTIPTAMPMAEQALLRQHAQNAVWCLWKMNGWDNPDRKAAPPPDVVVQLDEASATQLVFLYTMVHERFGGAVEDFLDLCVPRPDGPATSVRIASIDIGGGTTDLMVAEYVSERGGMLTPRQICREGPKLAGDDLVRDVIQSLVLPRLRDALEAEGMRGAGRFLSKFFTGRAGGQDENDRFLRRQFVLQVLEPAAYAILGADERLSLEESGELMRSKLRALLPDPASAERAVLHFEAAAAAEGVRRPVVYETEIVASAADVARIVTTSLGPMLVGLCKLVREAGCDWLLLSGRPSKLRAIRDVIQAELPVWPNRILPMHTLEVGDWYPFRDAHGFIHDPKTTAVVGAALAVYAERDLVNFTLRSSELRMRSTARFFGIIDNNDRLRANRVLGELPLDDRRGLRDVYFELPPFYNPVYLGYRQQEREDWPATPLFLLNWTRSPGGARPQTPLRIRLRRPAIEPGSPDMEAAREAFEIAEVYDAEGALIQDTDTKRSERVIELLLRTSIEMEYWRDSAALTVGGP